MPCGTPLQLTLDRFIEVPDYYLSHTSLPLS